jgi:hypothetical protein
MTLAVTPWLIIGATFLGGPLAGVAVDRLLVQLPAWQQTGPVAWAEFTRAADLGRGLLLYPAKGLERCCAASQPPSLLASTEPHLAERLGQFTQQPTWPSWR